MTAPTLASTFSGAHLVVTGATGFVGKVWLSQLLCHVPDVGRITLLVRGRRNATAQERVATFIDTSPAFRPLRAKHGAGLARFLDERIEVVDADLTTPGMGLDPAVVEELAASADLAVHIAGLTAFHPDPRKGFPVNVQGTQSLAALAARFRHPRVLHVSTAYVAGVADGHVPEQFTPGVGPAGIAFDVDEEIAACQELIETIADVQERTDAVAERAERLGWPNLYTFTKGLAEHVLFAAELDVTVVRPSVVEASRSFPFPAWNEDLNTSSPICWFCGTAFPALPADPDHVFDIIPVDAVTRWMTVVAAQHLRGEAAPIHHLASGDVNPANFRRITELTALAKRRHAARPGATTMERAVAALDVAPRRRDDLPWFTPDSAAQVAGHLGRALDRLSLPGGLGRAVRTARRSVHGQERAMKRLVRMLDQYRPFIHDFDWRFHTGAIRAAVAALHPDDQAAFADEVSTLDWRHYWLEVQYPAMTRWAFPLLDGQRVPADAPSMPPLTLGEHPAPWTERRAAEVA